MPELGIQWQRHPVDSLRPTNDRSKELPVRYSLCLLYRRVVVVKRKVSLRERMFEKRALLGFFQTQACPVVTELVGMCGYDFIFLDGEHGVFSEADFLQALRALAAWDTAAIVRVRQHDTHAMGRYMDMGVGGIVVPNVATAEQAQAFVYAMTYPPGGTRGFGASMHRATRYGMDVAAHFQAPRDGVALIVVIESARGVDNAESILAVNGVDGALIGAFDLSADLGAPGNFSSAEYIDAIRRVESAAAAHGKIIGAAAHPGFSLEQLLARGHRLLLIGSDISLLREGMSAQLAQTQALMGLQNPQK